MDELSKKKSIREIIGEAMGAASLCWEPKPTGVFDSSLCAKFLDETMKTLEEMADQSFDEAEVTASAIDKMNEIEKRHSPRWSQGDRNTFQWGYLRGAKLMHQRMWVAHQTRLLTTARIESLEKQLNQAVYEMDKAKADRDRHLNDAELKITQLESQVQALEARNSELSRALQRIADFDIDAQSDKTAHLVAWCSMVAEARSVLKGSGNV